MSEAYHGYDDCAGSLGPCSKLDALRARVAKLEAERDALRAEALVLRGALAETYAQWAGLGYTHPHLVPSIITSPIEQALSAPLTAAAAERVKAMEAATDMLRRIARGDVSPEAGRHGAIALFKASPYFAALDAKGEE